MWLSFSHSDALPLSLDSTRSSKSEATFFSIFKTETSSESKFIVWLVSWGSSDVGIWSLVDDMLNEVIAASCGSVLAILGFEVRFDNLNEEDLLGTWSPGRLNIQWTAKT
jgi:hypothetical protein